MANPRFTDKRPMFLHKNEAFKDMVKGRMAADIEVALKTSAGMPVKTGAMKSSTRHFRSPKGGFRVEIDKAYAAYQEAGVRAGGGHRVKNYTTPGTHSGFFMRAIDSVIKNKRAYVKEAARATGV